MKISGDFTAQGLSSVVWSLAHLRTRSHYLEALLLQARPSGWKIFMKFYCSLNFWFFAGVFDYLSGQGISNILWALARVHSRYPLYGIGFSILNRCFLDRHLELVAFLFKNFENKVENLKAQELTILIWATARLHYTPEPSALKVAEKRAMSILPTCNPQACTVMLWGFAKLSHVPSHQFMETYQHVCAHQAEKYNSQG